MLANEGWIYHMSSTGWTFSLFSLVRGCRLSLQNVAYFDRAVGEFELECSTQFPLNFGVMLLE